MKTTGLSRFLAFLQEQSSADLQGDSVDRFLSDYRLDPEDFRPYTHFRKDTYGRNLILRSDYFEMLLLTWMPRQRTPIHDHAGQRCWMVLQQGELSFKNYAPASDSEGCPRVQGPIETHASGEAVYIDDGIGSHSIANTSESPAVSLHLYAGPIPRCRIYNEATRFFQWVDLCYFTTPDKTTLAG